MILNSKITGKYSCVSLTEIGVSHKEMGIPNQDAICMEIENDNFVMAVSDGVGSCKKSEIGSEKAVSICLEIFKEINTGSFDFDGRVIVQEIVTRWKKSFDGNCREYCATLKGIMKLGRKAILFSIGDGFVAITSEGMKMISPSEAGVFTNETKCLDGIVSADDFWCGQFDIDTNMSYVALACTDGVANGITPGEELSFVQEIEQNVSIQDLETELKEFLMDVSQYSFDDKTLGVVKYER